MKNNIVVWSISLLILLGLGSCGGGYGEKGAWAENFKKAYVKTCQTGYSSMYSDTDATGICNCIANALEKQYAPTEINNPEIVTDLQTLGNSCIGDKKPKPQ